MIGSLRKFSSSIYAKIFLIVVAIPFILLGAAITALVVDIANSDTTLEFSKNATDAGEAAGAEHTSGARPSNHVLSALYDR